MSKPSYPVERLDYELPSELIAQQPLAERTASRLLHIKVADGSITDHQFSELPSLLPRQTFVMLNESRVIPARLFGKRAELSEGQGGGRVEVLFHSLLKDGECEALVGSSAKLSAGEQVELPAGWKCELLEDKQLDGMRVRYLAPDGKPAATDALLAYLGEHGVMPTPPYIKRDADEVLKPGSEVSQHDRERYQTTYAQVDGSVAAPTAGLHFDTAMLKQLRSERHSIERLALHVGMGTFAPVRAEDLAEHEMHEEQFSLEFDTLVNLQSAMRIKAPLLAVGTTSLRALHSLLDEGHTDSTFHVDVMSEPPMVVGNTRVLFYPGHGTETSDLLLTNFHLPRSTLLALVYSYGGDELLARAYQHAIASGYRFYSYGDCMLIDRREG